ncbi:MAG: molecular chaperone TorD family protein [Candidatus Cloacimonetes bacterium]|nr:molecular chaperone TorD family protein [Candidatus Cloacimonadota bacterium]
MDSISTINPGPFVLASVLSGYPDQNYLVCVSELLKDKDFEILQPLQNKLEQLIGNKDFNVEELSSEYLSIFDLSKSLNPLYETEYGRERSMFKTNELSDIAGFYKAFGFDFVDGTEMIDHVSVELEFYSLMMMKLIYLQNEKDLEGVAIVSDGMLKFMRDHLGRFVSSILLRPRVMESQYYSCVFQWIEQLVLQECKRLNINPELQGWFSVSQAEEEVSCAQI